MTQRKSGANVIALEVDKPAAVVLEATKVRLNGLDDCIASIEEAALLIIAASRLVVTGMGKCSHIGRKIVATMQSTGQPACFLHPGEALHGDLGLMQHGDALLALSNSGQTSEVLHVAHHCTGPLVVITSQPDSPLAHRAAAALVIPDGPEGDPLGLAPMASSTAMLVVGDMLAAQLMDARGFTVEQFLTLHHGGYLGQSIRGGR